MSETDRNDDPFLPTAEAGRGRDDTIAELRRQAADAYAAAGLPTRRVERWKFTDLNGLRKLAFSAAPPVSLDALPAAVPALDAPKLVLVNGRVDAELSDLDDLPKGVTARPIAEALAAGEGALTRRLSADAGFTDAPLAALNTAALTDGWLIDITDGTALEAPLHLVFVSANEGGEAAAFHPRLAVSLGQGASATLVESHVGAGGGPTFANNVAEIAVGRDAALDHYVLQNEGDEAFHIGSTAYGLEQGASVDGFTLQLGSALARREARALIAGPHAWCRLDGAYVGAGDQVLDNTLFVDHATPGSTSRVTVKGVVDGKARAVFQAKTRIRKDSQKSDAQQLHKALLLADGCEVDAKPELEIYADDVVCSHGATAGDLDHDQLFYLRARGIPEASARAMLIEAFLVDSVNTIRHDGVRAAFQAALAAKLDQIHGIEQVQGLAQVEEAG